MAKIFGTKASGKTGELDHEELTDLILAKSGNRAARKSCGSISGRRGA